MHFFGYGKPGKPDKRDRLQFAKNHLNRLLVNRVTVRLAHSFQKSRKTKIRDQSLKTDRAVQALQRILPKAEQLEIPLAIENHWGISSRPENILKIVNQFSSPFLGTCPDFDNFPQEVDPYQGLRMLAAKALHVHAKGIKFDLNGEEQNIDFRRCLGILKECGYDDTITVEYEGTGDAVKGCLQMRDLILKYW
jgi:sugar phosphate isomerase/epimerase